VKTFNEKSEAVDEVVAFVETDQVLARPFSCEVHDIPWATKIILSLEDVERFRNPDWQNSQIKGDMAWLDIQRIDEGKRPHLRDTDIWKYLENISKVLYEHLLNQLVPSISEYEMQEIAGFFEHLIFLRTTQGETDCFYEKLFTVYQAGGYPCGWSGSFPEGELIVYSRE